MKNKYIELLDAIAETIKGHENDIFATNGAAAETTDKLTEIEDGNK